MFVDQIRVSGEIIDNLRSKPSEIDGVGGRQNLAPFFHLFDKLRRGEKLLHACLGVVKISFDRDNMRVVSSGSDHLQLLYVAHAFLRVEHSTAGPGHVAEALKRRFAGVAAGGNQNADFPLFTVLHGGKAGQVRKQLERHIFEGQRRAMEKFQYPGGIVDLFHRSNFRCIKPFRIIGRMDCFLNLRNIEVLQVPLQDGNRTRGIIHLAEGRNPVHRNRREHGGDIQASVRRQAVQDCLAGRYTAFTAGGEERHE